MSATGKGVSRLGMMQVRLQEQLMLEKESRLLEMAARQDSERDHTIQRVTKSSASSLSSSLSSLSLGSSLTGQGRVRKMFEDRRSTGYDKSYPLHPVKSGNTKQPARGVVRSGDAHRVNSSDRIGGPYGQPRSRSQVAPAGQRAVPRQPPSRLNNNINSNNTSRVNHHKSNPSLLEANGTSINNNNIGSKYGRRPSNSSSISSSGRESSQPSRNEVKKPSPPRPNRTPPFKSKPTPSPSPRPLKLKSSAKPTSRPSLAPSPMPRKGSTASSEAGPRTVPPGMSQCPICERCFNPDRIDKHTEICKKSKAKAQKRKVFDPIKMRNKGTEAEKYVARGAHLKELKKPKKKDWRKQHEDFIATVRAAKGVKGYEAPPLDTSDYVQCPHCGRKFNEAAADRHIPKCADIKSNKPRR